MNADPFRRVPTKDEYKADLARETGILSEDDIARIIRASEPDAPFSRLVLAVWGGIAVLTLAFWTVVAWSIVSWNMLP